MFIHNFWPWFYIVVFEMIFFFQFLFTFSNIYLDFCFLFLLGLLYPFTTWTFISLLSLFFLDFFPLFVWNFIPLFYFDFYFSFLFRLFFRLLPIIVIPLLFQELCEISDRCYKWICHWKSIAQKEISTFFAYLGYKESFVVSVIPNWGYLRPSIDMQYILIHMRHMALAVW